MPSPDHSRRGEARRRAFSCGEASTAWQRLALVASSCPAFTPRSSNSCPAPPTEISTEHLGILPCSRSKCSGPAFARCYGWPLGITPTARSRHCASEFARVHFAPAQAPGPLAPIKPTPDGTAFRSRPNIVSSLEIANRHLAGRRNAEPALAALHPPHQRQKAGKHTPFECPASKGMGPTSR